MKTEKQISTAIDTVLENYYWISGIRSGDSYSRRHDDTDGENGIDQYLTIHISHDGDAWVEQKGTFGSLRFRTGFGGGRSPRVRNALLLLAEAIRRDNEEFPLK